MNRQERFHPITFLTGKRASENQYNVLVRCRLNCKLYSDFYLCVTLVLNSLFLTLLLRDYVLKEGKPASQNPLKLMYKRCFSPSCSV